LEWVFWAASAATKGGKDRGKNTKAQYKGISNRVDGDAGGLDLTGGGDFDLHSWLGFMGIDFALCGNGGV
jgi:hypothetical protein